MSTEYETYPLFRGATKPKMFFGVPLLELGAVATPCILLSLWSKILSGSLLGFGVGVVPLVAAFLIMRQWTKQDDQYVKMFVQNLRDKSNTRQCKIDGITVVTPKSMRHSRFMEW